MNKMQVGGSACMVISFRHGYYKLETRNKNIAMGCVPYILIPSPSPPHFATFLRTLATKRNLKLSSTKYQYITHDDLSTDRTKEY